MATTSRQRRSRQPGGQRGAAARSVANNGRHSTLPLWVPPQLATLSDRTPNGREWVHEMKFDGYRLLSRIERAGTERARLLTRNELDWTHKYPAIAKAVAALPVKTAMLDGELVALLPSGISSFQALQNAARSGDQANLAYFAFDLLFLNGRDLRSLPLLERKAALAHLLERRSHSTLRLSEHLEGDGPAFFRQCCQLGLEGVISKQADRPYRSGRSEEWIKTKCVAREELVIGGFTLSTAIARGIGALLVGYFDDEKFTYAGRVGTGFSSATLLDLRSKLEAIRLDACPFAQVPAKERGPKTRWVRPHYVAEIEFTGWTDGAILRHPSFQGLREDKPAKSIQRPESLKLVEPPDSNHSSTLPASSTEENAMPVKQKPAKGKIKRSGLPVELTHPDRLLFASSGLTKLGLATYYYAVAEWILPHLNHRPLSLVRCPEGAEAGKCFYQKHAAAGVPATLERIEIQEKNQKRPYLMANSLEGLLSLVQMSVLEIHSWGSRSDRLEQPDRLIFDLDPDEGLPWKRVVAAALRVRDLLAAHGLTTFVKTTGGKGLHVVLPISPRRPDWEAAKSFTRGVADLLVADAPTEFVANMSKAARRGKIFIDYLRNDRGATSIAPFSTRASPQSSVPLLPF
jgi:bifunctional non-homologous end joining protein LigD